MSHYNYHCQRGTLPPGKYLKTALDRFEKWCDQGDPGGHWLWTGSTSSGYGVIRDDNGEQEYTHRWAYKRFVGPIPEGLIVGHRCHDLDLSCRGGECFHRRCMRPEHLAAMTKGDNNRAGRSATLRREVGARQRAERTRCAHGHELTPENLYVRPSDGAQICRICTAEAKAKYLETHGLRPTRLHCRDRVTCPQGHPYDASNKHGARVCTKCARAAEARYRERKRQRAQVA